MGLVMRRQIGIALWVVLLFIAVIWSNLRSTSLEASGMGFAAPVEISSLETGRLMTLKVKLHDQVNIAEVVALLDPAPLEEQREVLVAQMQVVEQTVASDMLSDTRRAVTTQMRLSQLQTAIREDQALIAGYQDQKRRAENLASAGAGSANAVRDINNQIAVAEARLSGNRSAVASGLSDDPDADVPEENDWHVVAAARTLEMMDMRIKRMDLTAAIDGQVTMIYKAPGEVVFGGDPILQISRTGTSEVLAYLPTLSAIGLEASAVAWVVRSNGQIIKGALVSVGGSPQPLPEQLWHNPAYPEWGVPIRVKLASGEIGPGEPVVVRI